MNASQLLREIRDVLDEPHRSRVDAFLAKTPEAFIVQSVGQAAWSSLTRRQRDAVMAMVAWEKKHGDRPTLEQLAGVLGLSKVSVVELYRRCVERGVLVRTDKHRAKNYVLADRSKLGTAA